MRVLADLTAADESRVAFGSFDRAMCPAEVAVLESAESGRIGRRDRRRVRVHVSAHPGGVRREYRLGGRVVAEMIDTAEEAAR